jgi:dTDP-glucose 4,6-dehydratase
MLEEYRDVELLNFDALTYAGNLENLQGLEEDPRYSFVRGNVAEAADVQKAFAGGIFEAVVHFAAETHVDRSLTDVGPFISSNVLGTQVLLDAARRNAVKRFVLISTDEVYGSLGPTGEFTEETPIQPNNPYAATKAAADFLVRAAHKSHGLDVVVTRCSNNFGPFQFPEKLIPLMIANAADDKELPVYGDGRHVRDWLYVRDHCSAIDLVLRHGKSGEAYNIGGHKDVPNIEVVKLLLKVLGKPESLIRFVKDRPGHDRRYAMNYSKIQRELGWKPARSFEDALRETVEWYLSNWEWLEHMRSGRYQEYYEKMYGERLRRG